MLSLMICGIFAMATIWRAQFGIELSDEAYLLSIPHSIASGAMPFRDEWNVRQTGGILLSPFIWLYVKVTGTTYGLMFFGRALFLVGSLGSAWLLYRLLRLRFSREVSLLSAVFIFLAVPFNFFEWSYNSFAAHFLMLGLFFAWAAVEKTYLFFWSGCFLALSAWVYPSLLFLPFMVGMLVLIHRKEGLRPFVIGSVLVALPLLLLLGLAGSENVIHCVRYTARMSPIRISGDAVRSFLRVGLSSMGPKPFLLVAVGMLWLASRKFRSWLPAAVVLLFAVLTTNFYFVGYPASLGLCIRLAIVGWLLLAIFGPLAPARLFFWVGIPSLAAGIICGLTSTNGFLNAGIGLMPGAIVCLITVGCVLEKGEGVAKRISLIVPYLMVFLCLGWHQWHGPQTSFGEGPIAELTARLRAGPYAGLRTSAAKAAFIERWQREIVPLTGGAPAVAFHFMPGGYLFSSIPPAVGSSWTVSGDRDLEREYLDYYRRHLDPRTVFVWVRSFPMRRGWTRGANERDLLVDWVTRNQVRIYDSSNISVYRGLICDPASRLGKALKEKCQQLMPQKD